jgi:hypothetical protein
LRAKLEKISLHGICFRTKFEIQYPRRIFIQYQGYSAREGIRLLKKNINCSIDLFVIVDSIRRSVDGRKCSDCRHDRHGAELAAVYIEAISII